MTAELLITYARIYESHKTTILESLNNDLSAAALGWLQQHVNFDAPAADFLLAFRSFNCNVAELSMSERTILKARQSSLSWLVFFTEDAPEQPALVPPRLPSLIQSKRYEVRVVRYALSRLSMDRLIPDLEQHKGDSFENIVVLELNTALQSQPDTYKFMHGTVKLDVRSGALWLKVISKRVGADTAIVREILGRLNGDWANVVSSLVNILGLAEVNAINLSRNYKRGNMIHFSLAA